MSEASSNWRELTNLVDTLKVIASEGQLEGQEYFVFTDNQVSEDAFYNGSSSNESLFKLILELKLIAMQYKCIIRIIHIAGTRMQAQGTDGLSRGNLGSGVMGGDAILEHVPIHLNPFERSQALKPWLESWTDTKLEFLGPHEWFTRGHDHVNGQWESNLDFSHGNKMKYPSTKPGYFVWSSPPCLGHIMAEELRKCRHKRQASTHIVLIPRIMTPMWRKQLYKGADLVLTLPPGHHAWSNQMHEPLTLAIFFPFLSFRPWQLRGSISLLALGRELSRVWKDNHPGEGPLLRKLWSFQRTISSMPADLAWKVLQSENLDRISSSKTRKRRRLAMETKKGGRPILDSKKRRYG